MQYYLRTVSDDEVAVITRPLTLNLPPRLWRRLSP